MVACAQGEREWASSGLPQGTMGGRSALSVSALGVSALGVSALGGRSGGAHTPKKSVIFLRFR